MNTYGHPPATQISALDRIKFLVNGWKFGECPLGDRRRCILLTGALRPSIFFLKYGRFSIMHFYSHATGKTRTNAKNAFSAIRK